MSRPPLCHQEFSAWLLSFASPSLTSSNVGFWGLRLQRIRRSKTLSTRRLRLIDGCFIPTTTSIGGK